MGNQNSHRENENLNYAPTCPDCGKELEQKNGKLHCAAHNDFYVPLSTYPLRVGWTDDDWRELHHW